MKTYHKQMKAYSSLIDFFVSQILDVFIYQKIKKASHGKLLWLRTNASTFLGQIIDSSIFISIVFYTSHHKLNIFLGSIGIKIIISILMTPIVYCIVMVVDKYLDNNTYAFK